MQLRAQAEAQAQIQGTPMGQLCHGLRPPMAPLVPQSHLFTIHFLQGDFSSPSACLGLLS